ncbi:hypothetical protein AM588_10008218 [Phytophthora nicotianae]|uniref:Palmitoyltransferase n=1 Tax=Phytophthora nicotianae TaxID=4792 RepID=A0A0W8D3W7_PHYNI|nr:hypothetical protein AM588_10008218 [Phytophthora nicotianae]
MGCCCEWRAPKPLRFVLPCIIVGVIVYLYSSFVVYSQGRVLEAGASPWELLLFHIMTFLLCWSLAQTMRSGDSFLPRRTLTREKINELKLQAAEPDDALVETKMNGAIRTCRKCRALKPDRTHHCSTCRRCVLKMDHHCVYINNTLEYCEKRDDPDYINYYNVGIVRNFQEVFGTFHEFPCWFVPVHSPSFRKRDGKTFPLNTKFTKVD